MKNKLSVIVLYLLLFLLVNPIMAQIDKGKDKAAYNKAAGLRKEGIKYFLKDVTKAAKLFEEANLIYPGNPDASLGADENRNCLPALLISYGDVRGANKAIEKEISRLQKMVEVFTTNGISVNNIPASHWIKIYYILRANANLIYGDAALAFQDIFKIIDLGFDEKEYTKQHTTWSGGIGAATIQATFQLGQYVGFLNNDKELLETMQPIFEKMGDKNFVITGKIYLAIINKDFEQAIELATKFEQTGATNRITARYLIAYSYAIQKQTSKSEEYIKLLLKGIRVGHQIVVRVKVMNALNEKRYSEAINYANDALKPIRFLTMSYDQPGKFAYYALRAEAYAGLKQYEKAKDDFERALLYNQHYAPAINGLARIETAITQEQKTDNSPPIITLLEPGITPGVKINSSWNDLMVKGIAIDPSGIKEVRVNDNLIYFKADGNFWGSIPINNGINKIEIVVIDIAGNKATQILEIEKQPALPIITNETIPVTEKQGKNYALIIAAQNYNDNNIPSLENPVSDAIKLKLILKNNYNFSDDNIYTLYNPVVNDFKKKFAEMLELIQFEDNLVIFYAGHGIWVDKEKKGYWLLADAKRNDVNTWLSNKLVLDMIAKMPSRHILLITDACFSGSVFRTRGIIEDSSKSIKEKSNKVSRVAITSGNDSEVPDESVFMKYLVKALSENKDKYLTAQKMFVTQIIEAVMAETKTEPRYGTLELAGHVGGDYIFIKK